MHATSSGKWTISVYEFPFVKSVQVSTVAKHSDLAFVNR